MRIGFEATHLQPGNGGLYTYSVELIKHLSALPESPAITLLNGHVRGGFSDPSEIDAASLPPHRYASLRKPPLLRSTNGPWHKHGFGLLATVVDDCMMAPLWDRLHATSVLGPLLSEWRMPYRLARDFDVCHWPFEDIFVPAPWTANVATLHDLIVLRYPEWLNSLYVRDHCRKLQLIARHATRIIADSEHTRQDAIRLLGISPELIDVIPLAARPDFRPPVRRDSYLHTLARYGLHEGKYIVSVGILSHRKNVVRLGQAFKAALAQQPEAAKEGLKLVLAGGQGWKTGPIAQGLAALGLGERLVQPGRVPQEDLPALLHGARAVAYVSLYEGFGLPPLEAMACGAPVVASNTSSIPEVVGEAGLLVDPYDVRAMAAALGRVMTDDALRAELAARGLRRAGQFSWDKTAQLTMLSYRRAAASRSASCGASCSHEQSSLQMVKDS